MNRTLRLVPRYRSEFWMSGCESPLEEAFRFGMNAVRPFELHPVFGTIAWGFWSVEPQCAVGHARVDLYLASPVEVAVELDGRKYHSGEARIQADAKRERAIVAQGLMVIRFTGPEVTKNPVARARELAEILDALIDKWLFGRRGELQTVNPFLLRPWSHTRVP